MKRLIIALLLVTLLAAPVLAENHSRWNRNLEVCMYFYSDGSESGHCFVDAQHCEISPYMPDTYQTLAIEQCMSYSAARATVTLTIEQPNRPPIFKRPA